MKLLPEYLEFLQSLAVDALIVADMGVFRMAQRYASNIDLHISTQAGITNHESAAMWYELGASRVIPARELSIAELHELREKSPKELELEAFIHGAMCMSFSGRCLLSNYFTGRDANRGACAQPCRWKYYLVEEKRLGEYYEIQEDAGSYIFNSRDMCMIEHLDDLISIGMESLKIEGRMKSAYYTACVTNAYRHVLDSVAAGEKPKAVWLDEVNKVSHREYSTGFFYSEPGQYTKDSLYIRDWDVVGIVESCDDNLNGVVRQRNRFFKGDELELMTPIDEPVSFIAEYMSDASGKEIVSAPHPEMEIHMRLPVYAPKYSILRIKRKEK